MAHVYEYKSDKPKPQKKRATVTIIIGTTPNSLVELRGNVPASDNYEVGFAINASEATIVYTARGASRNDIVKKFFEDKLGWEFVTSKMVTLEDRQYRILFHKRIVHEEDA